MQAPIPAPRSMQDPQEVPLQIVGGNNFGRYNKINASQTWNCIVSDGFLVPYAGYKNILTQSPSQVGRGLYSSYRGSLLIAVWGGQVYKVVANNNIFTATFIGSMATSTGDVYIAENNNNQIAMTDGEYLYVYDYRPTAPETFRTNAPGGLGTPIVFPFTNPGYISFQNGNFVCVQLYTAIWFLSGPNDAFTWPVDAQHIGSLQTKPDYVQAAVPMPGGGNVLLLFGRNVVEQWQFTGQALFPYQRASTFNADYGCLNASTVAALNNYVVWLAVNEQSGPVLMVCSGSQIKSITTDGIDYKLGNLTDPTNCTGFLFQQDGHLLYQFTFITDNLSYVYDVETGIFFSVSDEFLNYHIARQVVYFNNQYFFVSLNGGNLYLFGSVLDNAQYAIDHIVELPRIRITPPLRLPSQRYFIARSLGFTIENGEPNPGVRVRVGPATLGDEITTEDGLLLTTENGVILDTESETSAPTYITLTSASVDLSISRDGGQTYGSSYRLDMNATGKRKSRFIYQRLGIANDATFQLRFYGLTRWVATDGVVEIYQ